MEYFQDDLFRSGHRLDRPPEGRSVPFLESTRMFIAEEPWTFAKTYAKTWPHFYLNIRTVGSRYRFTELVQHIRRFGSFGQFYSRRMIYFHEGDFTYWTMVAWTGNSWSYPLAKEDIINMCPQEWTYESRLKNGLLDVAPALPDIPYTEIKPEDVV